MKEAEDTTFIAKTAVDIYWGGRCAPSLCTASDTQGVSPSLHTLVGRDYTAQPGPWPQSDTSSEVGQCQILP